MAGLESNKVEKALLGNQQFQDLVQCTLSREKALEIMESNLPPGVTN